MSKYMMSCLFIVMLVLVIRAVTLPNAVEGLKFYLIPDFQKMMANGLWGRHIRSYGTGVFHS